MIHAQYEIGLAVSRALSILPAGLADGKLVRPKGVFRPKIARADAIGATENPRRLLESEGWDGAAVLLGFESFAQRDADIAGERVVSGQAFVGTFYNDDLFLSAQGIDDRCLGKGAQDVDMN